MIKLSYSIFLALFLSIQIFCQVTLMPVEDCMGKTIVMGDTLTIVVENKSYDSGEVFTVHFRTSNFTNLLGYQFGIAFDPSVLTFEEITEGDITGMTEANFGTQDSDIGQLKTNWLQVQSMPETYSDGTTMFGLTFTALQDINNLSDYISFDDTILNGEAYDGDNQIWEIVLSWDGISSVVEAANLGYYLYQNQPNPFAASTQIAFELPRAMDAELVIYNALGKVIKVFDERFFAGRHEVNWTTEQAEVNGLYYYVLKTKEVQLTRRMVVAF